MVATITRTPTNPSTTTAVMATRSIHPSLRRLPTLGPTRNDPPRAANPLWQLAETESDDVTSYMGFNCNVGRMCNYRCGML